MVDQLLMPNRGIRRRETAYPDSKKVHVEKGDLGPSIECGRKTKLYRGIILAFPEPRLPPYAGIYALLTIIPPSSTYTQIFLVFRLGYFCPFLMCLRYRIICLSCTLLDQSLQGPIRYIRLCQAGGMFTNCFRELIHRTCRVGFMVDFLGGEAWFGFER